MTRGLAWLLGCTALGCEVVPWHFAWEFVVQVEASSLQDPDNLLSHLETLGELVCPPFGCLELVSVRGEEQRLLPDLPPADWALLLEALLDAPLEKLVLEAVVDLLATSAFLPLDSALHPLTVQRIDDDKRVSVCKDSPPLHPQ